MSMDIICFRFLKIRVALVFLLAFLLFSKAKAGLCQNAQQTPMPVNPQGTLVFLDISVSMKGYFKSQPPLLNFQQFLQTDFRDILSSNQQLASLSVSTFGTSLTPPKAVNGFMFTPDDFTELNTDIISVFKSAELEQHLLSIVITDGVQSDPDGGFNKGLMGRVIREKIDAGFFLYLVGAKMEFDGYIYSEIHHIKAQKQLAIPHQGVRPIYFWIATRDKQLGKSVSDAIMQGLETAVTDKNLVGIVNFNEPECPTIKEFSIEERSKYHLAWQIKDTPPLYEIKLYHKPKKQSYIEIPIKIDVPNDAWAMTMDVNQPEQFQWAEIHPASEANSEKKLWTLMLDYQKISSERHSLSINISATFRPEGYWWSTWSTLDDSLSENADKTLYLKELTWGLLKPFYAQPNALTSINIIVQKKRGCFDF